LPPGDPGTQRIHIRMIIFFTTFTHLRDFGYRRDHLTLTLLSHTTGTHEADPTPAIRPE
jgi:hypothetical protein